MHEAFDDGRRSVLGDCGLERLKREGRDSARFPSPPPDSHRHVKFTVRQLSLSGLDLSCLCDLVPVRYNLLQGRWLNTGRAHAEEERPGQRRLDLGTRFRSASRPSAVRSKRHVSG